jgi:hypothetical protein
VRVKPVAFSNLIFSFARTFAREQNLHAKSLRLRLSVHAKALQLRNRHQEGITKVLFLTPRNEIFFGENIAWRKGRVATRDVMTSWKDMIYIGRDFYPVIYKALY